jgi:L-ascorbate metabolism protein UlaG (beta-lactamase superfamily)
MLAIGIEPDRTSVLNADECLIHRGISIEPIAAAHETDEVDADGYHRFLGFLLHWGNRTLYHGGDTLVTSELSHRLAREHIDIGFLPVNGADDARTKLGIAGNMDVAAAAALAAENRFGLFVPMHYDLYSNNGLTAEQLAETWARQPAAAQVPLKTFVPGECLHQPNV